jgi:hypothetical protein
MRGAIASIKLSSLLYGAGRKDCGRSRLVATAYEQKQGRFSRVVQCALAYLFTPSTDIYSCPLAMTDGAAHVTQLRQSSAHRSSGAALDNS